MKRLIYFLSLPLLALCFFLPTSVSAQAQGPIYNCDIPSTYNSNWLQSVQDNNQGGSLRTNADTEYALTRVQGYNSGSDIGLWLIPSGWDIVYTYTSSNPQFNVVANSGQTSNGNLIHITLSESLNYKGSTTRSINGTTTNSGITVFAKINCLESAEGNYYKSPQNISGIPTTNYWQHSEPDNKFPYSLNQSWFAGMLFDDAPSTGGGSFDEPIDVNLFSSSLAEPLEVSGGGSGMYQTEFREVALEYFKQGSALALSSFIGYTVIKQVRFRRHD